MNNRIQLYWIMTPLGAVWIDIYWLWTGHRYYRSYQRNVCTMYFGVMDDFGNLVSVPFDQRKARE